MSAFTAQPPDFLRKLLAPDFTLVALFSVLVLEGAMLFYVTPSELLVPGTLAPVGERLLFPILAVAVSGATAGQVGLSLTTKRGGHECLLSRSWFRINENSLDRFDSQLDRWGPVVVSLSSVMLFTRGMLTVPAGLPGTSVKRFLALSVLGIAALESTPVTLYVFGG